MAEKSYRIRTNVGQDTVVKASLTQDIEFLEILSLKINQEDTYKLHVSNYGIIVGRVLGNESFGIPNAKVSVFIKLSEEDKERSEIVNLYPYQTIMTKDKENRRYNLLSDSSDDDCHRIVGTFPNKRLVLDNETEIEIYEKYWKYTTITNQSGDFMIFGVPTGNHTIHVDIDLSDIGILSQKPRDFFYKGYNKEQFDSPEQFKEGTDLENLTQLLSQDTSVYVYPFFGDSDINDIAITRCDVQVPYKFEPTCVFFGSIVSDRKGQHIGHKCGPSRWIGYNRNMITGEGTIEMIRKTPDGLVEEFPIKGNHLIDGDGVWCYQIPMNLDYIGTDEFGNIVPVQDSTKGIPTRTSVRFRISMQETTTLTSTEHVAKYLVPNVHELNPKSNYPQILQGKSYQSCYEFGSATPKEYFRDLMWNKVYSVKNYIPRFEYRNWVEKVFNTGERGYSGIRSVSSSHNNNVFPFNSARFHLKFTYRVLCVLMSIVVDIMSVWNTFISKALCKCFSILGFKLCPLKWLTKWVHCVGMKGEMFFAEQSDIYYFPGCTNDCGSITKNEGLIVEPNANKLMDVIQQSLALEYEIVNLDFYNDWINGTLYMPLWFWKKRAKKKYLFGLFSRKAVNAFCSCDKQYEKLSLSQSCSTKYDANYMPLDSQSNNKKRHNNFEKKSLKFGVIKEFTNRDGLNVYYYAPGVPNDLSYQTQENAVDYTQLFATDIILLGSLNNCDLDNLPKTFNSLPSTTVNLPFIATLKNEESGDGVVTGLDWGHEGDLTNGLLMNLSCWDVDTQFKSCVNLSRLSELHVTFDMDITSEDDSEQSIYHDGIITDLELVENETRAKFASMNHNGLTNLVKNPTTNYDTYKFHYIYPIYFDGHLNNTSTLFEGVKNKNRKKITENRDSNYVMYRLGEGKDSINGRHKKHFYNGTETNFSFPLFNNSYYFYFGLNEGKTSIDKFNAMFNASCAKRNKYGFTIDYVSKPGKWCYNTANIRTDFGTIDVKFEGLTDTFSYSLYNEFNELLISETNVKSDVLRFGYEINDDGKYTITNDGYVKDGRLKELKTNKFVKNIFNEPRFLENGVYFLEVTNAFGLKVTQRINVIQNTISPNIEVISLGTKYNASTSVATDICGKMDYQGELKIKSFIIDGEEAFITNVENYFIDGEDNENKPKELTCKVTCTDGSEIYLILEPENDETQDIDNFVCYGKGNTPSIELELSGDGIYTLKINIWKPGDYVLTSNQLCNNVMNDNVSVYTFSIENGEKFQAYLNDVPFEVINNDYFNNKLKPNDSFPRAWLQIENPNMYNFSSTLLEDVDYWDNFLKIDRIKEINENGNVKEYISNLSKIDIIKFQLEVISKMRDISYIYGDGDSPQIVVTTKGGKEPILIRNIHPNYATIAEENGECSEVIIDSSNVLDMATDYPHIIDKRYQNTVHFDDTKKGIRLNDVTYSSSIDNKAIGNYFAAFTNNGGLIPMNNGSVFYDYYAYVESIPPKANPLISYSTTKNSIINNFPSIIKNNYIKTLTVDKLLFVTGDLLIPVYCDYDIYDNDNGEWKNGRWPLKIFNVAPLIYDDDYNIIGEDLTYNVKIKNNDKKTVSVNYSSENVTDVWTCSINGTFNNKGFGTITATASTEENAISILKEKFSYIYDNVATDFEFKKNDKKIEISYYPLNEIKNINELNENVDIRLTSNLMWGSDLGGIKSNKTGLRNSSRIYKCVLDIDGVETDVRSSFYHYLIGSEKNENGINNDIIAQAQPRQSEGLIITMGNSLSLVMANNKMQGNLEYSFQNTDDENNKYVFKSHVESAKEISVNFDIGNRIGVKSAAINYSAENSGEYILWNNERIYFRNQKNNHKKYYFYKKNISGYTDNDYVIEYIKNNKKIDVGLTLNQVDESNGPLCQITVDNKTINGFIWVRRQTLQMTLTELESLYENNNSMQEILNKFGIPYYTCITKNSRILYTFDPYSYNKNTYVNIANIKTFGEYKIGENIYYDYCVFEETKNNGSLLHLLTYDEIFNQFLTNGNVSVREKNGYFYQIRDNKNENTIFLPTLLYLNENNKNEITSFTYNKNFTYDISLDIVDKNEYLIPYYYILCDDSKIFNESYKFDYRTSWIDGNVITIDGKTIGTIEYNPFVNKWFLRQENDNNTVIYSQVRYVYAKYEKLEQSKEDNKPIWFYEGGKDELSDNNKIVLKYNIGDYDGSDLINYTENIIVEKNDGNISFFQNLEQAPQIQNGLKTCWSELEMEYSKNENDNTLLISGNKYLIMNGLFNKFIINNIDDFSCIINTDKFNDSFSKIETNAPFLSCAVIRDYGLKSVTINEENIGETYFMVEEWKKNNDVIINEHPKNEINCHIFQNHSSGLYQNQYVNIHKLWAKHKENNDIELSPNNNIVFDYSYEIFTITNKTISNLSKNSSFNKWYHIVIHYNLSKGIPFVITDNNQVLVFAKGDFKVEDGQYSFTIRNNNEFESVKINAQKIMKNINWVVMNSTELVQNSNVIYDDFYGYRSIKNKGDFIINELNLNSYGFENNKQYYYTGTEKIRNVFQENLTPNQNYLRANSNLLNVMHFGNDNDKEINKEYRIKSTVIGEMYPYINKYVVGSLEDKKFVLDSENEYLLGIGLMGKQYEKYSSLPFYYPLRENYYYFIDKDGKKTNLSTLAAFQTERMGVGLVQTSIYEYNKTPETVYENSEIFNDIIYVYQPNNREDIIKGTEIISCNFVKTYYDDNENYRCKTIPTYSQSCSFHVGPVYIGNVTYAKSDLVQPLLPLYFPKNSNQDIKRSIGNDLNVYFDNKKCDIVEYSNDLKLQNGMVTIYKDKEKQQLIGTSDDINIVLSRINEGYCEKFPITEDGTETYFVDMHNCHIKVKDNKNNIFRNKFAVTKINDKQISIADLKRKLVFRCRFGVFEDKDGYVERFKGVTSDTTNYFVIPSRLTDYNTFKFSLDPSTPINNAQFIIDNEFYENGELMNFSFSNETTAYTIKKTDYDDVINADEFSLISNNNKGYTYINNEYYEIINNKLIYKYGIECDILNDDTNKTDYINIPYINHLDNDKYYVNENKIISVKNGKEYGVINLGDKINLFYLYDNISSLIDVFYDDNGNMIGIYEGKQYELKPINHYYEITIENGEIIKIFKMTNTIRYETIDIKINTKTLNSTIENNAYYIPFSNIWKHNPKLSEFNLNKFNDDILINFEKLYNDGTTVEEFICAVVTTMAEDYNKNHNDEDKIDLNNKVTLDNIEQIWNKINDNKNNILENNYFITVKTDKKFVMIDNKLYFEQKKSENYRVISYKGKDYPISGYSVDKQEYDIRHADFVKINNIEYNLDEYVIINDIRYEFDVSEIKDLYNVFLYDSYKNSYNLVQTHFDFNKLKNNAFISKIPNENNMYSIQKIPAHLNNDDIIDEIIDKLLNLSNGQMIEFCDYRCFSYLVQITNVNMEKKYFEYLSPFTEQLHLKHKIESLFGSVKYDKDNIFYSVTELTKDVLENITFEVGDVVGIRSYVATLDTQNMVEIQCDDGYTFIGLLNENMTVINNNGVKNNFTFKELLTNGALGQNLYHLEEVDGLYYEFVSKIKDMKEINCDFLIKLPKLNDNHKCVLSLEVNNIIHKYPFICQNNLLKPL